MGKFSITIVSNVKTEEYFFTTDHCQCFSKDISDNLVPVTYYLPYHIVPRKNFESGVIKTKAELKLFLDYHGHKEIRNPDIAYQPEV